MSARPRSGLWSGAWPWVLLSIAAVGIVVVTAVLLSSLSSIQAGGAAPATDQRPAVGRDPPRVSPAQSSNGVTTSVLLQQPIERMPDGAPYVMRVTELEMEPGTKIFEHRQLGVGAHVVARGAIAIENLETGQTLVHRAGEAYFEGLGPLHRAENVGSETNRVLMVDILSASRGFDGTQQFSGRGRHNEGELRSGPYVQVPLGALPAESLMLRVSRLAFGPKAKTPEHTRVGPTMFFVQEGTATVRKEWANSSMTYGTNGYFFEAGNEPFILENKPATPAQFLAVELLPASLGDGASQTPTDGAAAPTR